MKYFITFILMLLPLCIFAQQSIQPAADSTKIVVNGYGGVIIQTFYDGDKVAIKNADTYITTYEKYPDLNIRISSTKKAPFELVSDSIFVGEKGFYVSPKYRLRLTELGHARWLDKFIKELDKEKELHYYYIEKGKLKSGKFKGKGKTEKEKKDGAKLITDVIVIDITARVTDEKQNLIYPEQ